MGSTKASLNENLQSFTPNEKKRSLKANPITKFDKEDIGSPSIEGAKIDLTIKLN